MDKKSKKSAPLEHWEKRYNVNAASQDMHNMAGSDFVPKCPRNRETTHLKVNEVDH